MKTMGILTDTKRSLTAKIIAVFTVFALIMSCFSVSGLAYAASYKGTVTLYGTPDAAIKSGPVYRSKVTIDLGTRTGQSWNNVSYTIPQVSDYFVLNDGWTIDYVNVAGNSSGKRQPGASFLLGMSGGSMVYYFKQTSKTFTLEYNANGGSGAPAQQTATATGSSYNFTVSSTSPTRDGYDFLGWSISQNATSASYQPGTSISVGGTTTLYAVWQKNEVEKVTLTYIDRGLQYAQDTYDKGESATVKNCTNTRNGYTFQGWATNSAAENVVYAAGKTFTISEDTTLYAVWSKNPAKMTVTWKDGYTDDPIKVEKVSKTITDEELEEYYPADPTREGYTFNGWGDPEKDEDGNITITAKWKKATESANPIKYVLNYMVRNADNDGTVADMPETYTATSSGLTHDTQVSTQVPTRDGYTFSHWTLGPAGKRYDSGADFHFEATSNQTTTVTWNLYAHWTKDPDPVVTVTVTWVDEDGTSVLDGPITFNKGEDEPTTDVTPTKADDDDYTYKFAGWDRSEDENGNVTYTATYTATPRAKYTVTYTDGVDGEEVFADQVTGSLLSGTATPAFVDGEGNAVSPTREGYTFIGWDPEVADTVTGNATYTAQWEAVPPETEPVTPAPGTEDPTDPINPPAEDPTPNTPNQPNDNPNPATPNNPVTAPVVPAAAVPAAAAPAAAPAAPDEATINDETNPLAQPEEQAIPDDENALAGFDDPHCWTHILMIIGMILTVVYGACVIARRKKYTNDMDDFEKNVLGEGEREARRASVPSGSYQMM